ncbi:MAG: hypothetical protein HOV68_29050, partial [Streptomycetaceae bacterium]|nr:hypothetical protein [Streptomycetaceae bacterium]
AHPGHPLDAEPDAPAPTPAAGIVQDGAAVAAGAAWDRLPVQLVASMDDEELFGPRAFELPLTEAIDRGLLARFQIIVMDIHDPAYQEAQRALAKNPDDPELKEAARGKRMAALQAAVLKAAAEHGLRTVLTFHHRVLEARAFATSLPRTAQHLHADRPTHYPHTVASTWLSGRHTADERRAALARFAAGVTEDGERADCSFLANAKVIAEGVDVPEIDAVAFCDPKTSIVDSVQIVGRALRQPPHAGKIASVLVPAFHDPSASPGAALLTSAAYEPLANVLQALRAHTADVVDRLAIPQTPGIAQGEAAHGLALPEDAHEDGSETDADSAWARMPLLRFSTRRDPVEVAAYVRLRVIAPESGVWLEGLEAARRFSEREGHLRVPQDYWEGPFFLGRWIGEQRRLYFAGHLSPERVAELDALGMVWRIPDALFAEGIAFASAYLRAHGHLAAPTNAVIDDYRVGEFLKNQRRPGALDNHPTRKAALDALYPHWNPPWGVVWQRNFATVHRHLFPPVQPPADTLADAAAAASGRVPRLRADTFELVIAGEDFGAWVRRQVRHWDKLASGQQRLLRSIGLTKPSRARTPARGAARPATAPSAGTPTPKPAATTRPVGRRSHDERFMIGLAAAAQFRAREGHLEVPRHHTETITDGPWAGEVVRLGVWTANMRTRIATMAADRRDALVALGLRLP